MAGLKLLMGSKLLFWLKTFFRFSLQLKGLSRGLSAFGWHHDSWPSSRVLGFLFFDFLVELRIPFPTKDWHLLNLSYFHFDQC